MRPAPTAGGSGVCLLLRSSNPKSVWATISSSLTPDDGCRLPGLPHPHPSVPRTGPYAFRTEAVAAGQAAIKAAVERSDIIVIDEIGPLEFEGQGWAAPLQVALAEGVAGQELLLAVRPSLVDRLAERFPSTAWGAAECVSPAAGG